MILYPGDRADALLAEVQRAERARREAGLDPASAMVQFRIKRRKSPANWDRCRVTTGIVGRVIGEEVAPSPYSKGEYLVDVLAADVRKQWGPRPCGPPDRSADS